MTRHRPRHRCLSNVDIRPRRRIQVHWTSHSSPLHYAPKRLFSSLIFKTCQPFSTVCITPPTSILPSSSLISATDPGYTRIIWFINKRHSFHHPPPVHRSAVPIPLYSHTYASVYASDIGALVSDQLVGRYLESTTLSPIPSWSRSKSHNPRRSEFQAHLVPSRRHGHPHFSPFEAPWTLRISIPSLRFSILAMRSSFHYRLRLIRVFVFKDTNTL
ncbi:hypothetical protein BDN70DRAFT_295744 [Pholiota conissans]|uniref:Uncharacterized protein n=1 Tax=Pholiota conissans TaxID=109636 RepID=A0A9P6CW29_9AGAR|nr:hypothetical protein BDN70DRAFT_295744 [Pholiota conissans]